MVIQVIIVILVLGLLSLVSLLISTYTVQIYNKIGEPLVIHLASISGLLFFTFFTGAIGIALELDQTSHPLFMLNLIFVSLSYVEIGFIYRSLNTNHHPVLSDYFILFLMFGPMYGVVLLLGASFQIVIAFFSQLIPLVIVTYMDTRILREIQVESTHFTQKADIMILQGLKTIFRIAQIVHGMGIIAILTFGIYAILGIEYQLEQIWSSNWTSFDSVYLIAAIIMLGLFVNFALKLKIIANYLPSANIDLIMNSLMN